MPFSSLIRVNTTLQMLLIQRLLCVHTSIYSMSLTANAKWSICIFPLIYV